MRFKLQVSQETFQVVALDSILSKQFQFKTTDEFQAAIDNLTAQSILAHLESILGEIPEAMYSEHSSHNLVYCEKNCDVSFGDITWQEAQTLVNQKCDPFYDAYQTTLRPSSP